jgi:hypothetical protein
MHFIHHLADLVTAWNGDIVAIANIFVALGTLVLAVGVPLSILYSARQEKDTFYATLDKTYFDIQQVIIDHPHVRDPNPHGKTADQLAQYDAFAFMTWNFVEAIYDYSQHHKPLRETWDCILKYEAQLHGRWFNEPRNHGKFKANFREYIRVNNCIPTHHASFGGPRVEDTDAITEAVTVEIIEGTTPPSVL